MKILFFRKVKQSLLMFFFIIVVFFSLLFLSFWIEQNNFLDKMRISLSSDIHAYQATFTDELIGIASDVEVIKQLITQNNVLAWDGSTTMFVSPEAKAIVENSMLTITQSIKYFDQMRILNTAGMEIVRINNGEDLAYIVDEVDLQDKSDRYYFTESILLDDNYIYISRLDLNVGNGQIEINDGDYKPVLRFATPIYSDSDQLLGVLVVNYLVNDIFDSLAQLKQNEASQIDIINDDGYYLMSGNDEIEFGFMFDDKLDETVDKYHDFDVLSYTDSTIQQFTVNGYIYTTMSMDDTLFSNTIANQITGDIILTSGSGSYILFSQLAYRNLPEYQQRMNTYLIIGAFLVIIAYVMTRLFDEIEFARKERIYTLKYLSEHDYLTSLPNRAFLMSAIESYVSRHKRMSLMFIDLDGFKNVNDVFGHAIGDASLIESAKRITDHVRDNDIVARVGGDEFIVLFDDLDDIVALKQIAKRILDSFKVKFVFDEVETTLGVSIGIAVYHKGQTIDDLINAADQAMYSIKEHGKNNFAIFK